MEKSTDDKSKRLVEGLKSALGRGGEDGRRGESIILCSTWSQRSILNLIEEECNLDDNW